MGRALVPDISITDPRLLTTMPERLERRHRSRRADPRHRVLRLAGPQPARRHPRAQRRRAGLRATCRTMIDRPRRGGPPREMAQASLEAGLAFTNAILGATHAMSHQVGGLLDAPHGVVNGVLLPHVIRYNAAATPRAVRRRWPRPPGCRSTGARRTRRPSCSPTTCARSPTTSACRAGCGELGVDREPTSHRLAHQRARRRLPDDQPARRPTDDDLASAVPGRAVSRSPTAARPSADDLWRRSPASGRARGPTTASCVRSDERMTARRPRHGLASRARWSAPSRARARCSRRWLRAAAAHLERRLDGAGAGRRPPARARPRFLAVGRRRRLIDIDDERLPACAARRARAGPAHEPTTGAGRSDRRLGPGADDARRAAASAAWSRCTGCRADRRAERPVGAAHPGQPGGRLAAHLRAVPGRRRPCTAAPSGSTTRRPRRRRDLADRTAELRAGRGAAAARPPARAARRRAAPDRPRAARQRHPVRPLGRHGRRGRRGDADALGDGAAPVVERLDHRQASSSPGGRRPAAVGDLRAAPAARRHRLDAARAAARAGRAAPSRPRRSPCASRAGRSPCPARRRPRARPHRRRGAVQRGHPRPGDPGDRPAALPARAASPLSVADDGDGDPRELRRLLRLERRGDSDGRHRGLANMAQPGPRTSAARSRSAGPGSAASGSSCGRAAVARRRPTGRHAPRSEEHDDGHDHRAPPRARRTDPSSIVLVDDHAIVRQGLRSVLEREADLRVVGEAASAAEAHRPSSRASRPAIVLLDLKLSTSLGQRGPRPVPAAHRRAPRGRRAGADHVPRRQPGGRSASRAAPAATSSRTSTPPS